MLNSFTLMLLKNIYAESKIKKTYIKGIPVDKNTIKK